MNDTTTSPSRLAVRSKARLYPFFVAGFGFLAIGLYFGLQADQAVVEEVTRPLIEGPGELVVDHERVDKERLEPHDFRYQAGDAGTYEVNFRQVNEYRDAEDVLRSMETRLSFELVERAVDSPDEQGPIRLERTFSGVKVDSLEEGRRVGSEITRQLELLVEGARQAVWMGEGGQIQDQAWISDTNPQIQQTLLLIHDGLSLLHPHLRFDPVLVGETWTYRVDGRLLEVLEAGTVDAAVEVVIHNRFEGMLETSSGELAVITQTLELEFKGALGGGEEFKSQGQGRGLVLFDLERGAIAASRLNMNRVTKVAEAPPLSSSVDLLIVRKDDVLGEFLK